MKYGAINIKLITIVADIPKVS